MVWYIKVFYVTAEKKKIKVLQTFKVGIVRKQGLTKSQVFVEKWISVLIPFISGVPDIPQYNEGVGSN